MMLNVKSSSMLLVMMPVFLSFNLVQKANIFAKPSFALD